MKVLMIDNYDSFTYNIVQYLGELGAEVQVYRNDQITLDEIAALRPERLVISPGPCSPHEAGVSVPAIQRFAGRIPILGVCLGHQSIGAALGGKIIRAREQMHGKTAVITTDQKGVYKDLPKQFTVIRYHSLAIEQHFYTMLRCQLIHFVLGIDAGRGKGLFLMIKQLFKFIYESGTIGCDGMIGYMQGFHHLLYIGLLVFFEAGKNR